MPQIDPVQIDPIKVFLSCFTLSSLGGLARTLREKQQLTVQRVIAAMLYSGVVGVIVGLIWSHWFLTGSETSIYFLVGISALAGIGGADVLDIIWHAVSQGGLSVNVRLRNEENHNDEPPQPDA